MELEVYWLDFAQNKLEDIYSYYSIKANKLTALKIINGIVDCTANIENNPEMGQIELFLKHRPQQFRYLLFKNYKIVYWINYKHQRIEIANVFDTRQNPDKINETK